MREHDRRKTTAARKGIKATPSRRSRRQWSQEEKRQLLERWKRSGQSRLAFSREQGLCYAGFLRWTREAAAGDCGRFVEVKLEQGAADRSAGFDLTEVIAPNGWRVRLPTHLESLKVRELLSIIAAC